MIERMLVTYATKHGATAEIAMKIGDVLSKNIPSVDVIPIHEVKDIAVYEAIIVGSAVYVGRWRKEARQKRREADKWHQEADQLREMQTANQPGVKGLPGPDTRSAA